MKRLILGTAGHIDHGKSSLVKVLTGVDPDRLSEEKRRGITIELGFAELTVGDLSFGVVDVPGHERFVRTMVAGATGIDVVMLVVAADAGVMPQTREHLAICSLLGIQSGLVVITKSDLADEELLELLEEDVRLALDETFLQDAPILFVSSHTSEGIDALKQALVEVGKEAQAKAERALMRLPVDRVFEQRGFGPVITGTLASGRLQEGDAVTLLPEEHKGRVRGIQNHSNKVSEAIAGMRTAVNLQGIPLENIHRGQVVVHTDALRPTDAFDARIQMLPHLPKPLKHRAPLLLHVGTVQTPCRLLLHERAPVAPGGEALARILPEQPVVLLPEDRFILRGFQRLEQHGTTFGGGVVLDPFPTQRRKDPGILARLALLEEGSLEENIPILVEDAGQEGIDLAQLSQRVGETGKTLDKALSKCLSQGQVIRYEREPARLIHAGQLQALEQRTLSLLAAYHEAHPLEEGMSRESLRAQLQLRSMRLYHVLLERLQKAESVVAASEFVRLASHRVRVAEEEEALRQQLLQVYLTQALTPPRARDLPAMLDQDEEDVQAMMELLVRQEHIVRVRDDLYFSTEVLEQLKRDVVAFLEEHDEMSAQDFKGITGASRKFSIPLAEYLDQLKLTIRAGEVRKLLRRPRQET